MVWNIDDTEGLSNLLSLISQISDYHILVFEDEYLVYWDEKLTRVFPEIEFSKKLGLSDFIKHIGMEDTQFAKACFNLEDSDYFPLEKFDKTLDMKIGSKILNHERKILLLKISPSPEQEELSTLHRNLAIQKLVKISESQIESTTELDLWLKDALQEIGLGIHADRIFLFIVHNQKTLASRTHSWVAPGIESSRNPFQDITTDDFPYFHKTLVSGSMILIEKMGNLPPEAENELKMLQREGIRSLLIMPLLSNGNPMGLLSLSKITEEWSWTEQDIDFLKSCSELIIKGIEKRKTESTLRLVQFTFDKAPDPVLLIDNNGNLVYVNDALCELLEYETEELLDMKITHLSESTHQDEWNEHWENLRQKGWDRFETYLVTKSGKRIPIEASMNYFEYYGIGYNCAFVRNITERKAIKEQLESDRFQLLSIFDGINEMVYVADTDTYELVFANKYTLDLIDKKKALGLCYEELYGFEEPCWFCTKDTLSTLGKQPFYYQYTNPVLKKDFMVHDRLIQWPGGRVVKFALAIDITQGRAAERALRASEERYRRMAETIRDGLTIVENGQVVYVNDRLVEITGYSKEELANMSGFDLAAPEEIEQLKQLTRTTDSVIIRPNQLDYWIIRKDGERRFISNRYSYHDKGDIVYRYIVTTDMTERKLAEDQLKEARARAEFFNDLMAHDLNNMHQGILTALELAVMHPDMTDSIREILSSALDQVQRSVALITNVKKFSKIIDEDIQLIRLDLHQAILESMEQVRNSFPMRKITLNTSTMPASHFVLADEFLVDLFYNLFHNSVKVATEERVILDVSVRWSKARDFLEVSVSDHGPGVSPEMKKTLFTRYQDSGTQGSGVGLTLVRRIVEHYGGNIRVADRVIGDYKKGASFKVLLPAA